MGEYNGYSFKNILYDLLVVCGRYTRDIFIYKSLMEYIASYLMYHTKSEKFKRLKMNKILLTALVISLMSTAIFAKNITIEGTYTGSECGDLCYMNFKTSKGIVNLYGYVEDYKNVKKGKKYTITYEQMQIEVAELGKINVNGIVNIKVK